jgi:prepilin-type N-terminal cleavage/methylation domain-containing protein
MNKNQQQGFSAIELLITLIVVGIVFMAFTTTYAGLLNLTKKGTDIATASQIAFAKLQEYENYNYNDLPAGGSGSLAVVDDFSSSLPAVLEAPRVGQVYINSSSPTLKQIVVRVAFGAGPAQRYIEYTTFIQKHGVGR